ncbi:MAG: ATP-binding protein [Phormidesmis sp.]
MSSNHQTSELPTEAANELSVGSSVLETHPVTASGRTVLPEVLARMAAAPKANCVVAVHRRKVVGIATHQDLIQALTQNSDWHDMKLSQVITQPAVTVSRPDLNQVDLLLKCFDQHQINYLPVVDEGHLVGIIDRSRLLQVLHEQGAETRLQRQYQRNQMFSEITLKIRQSLQLKEILHTTVNEVQRLLQADRVLIYQVFPDGTGNTTSEAVVPPFPAILGIPFPEEVFPEEYQALYAQGRVRAIADVHAADSGLADCLVEFIDQWSIQAKLIVPIVHPLKTPTDEAPSPSNLWGLLIAHQCRAPRQWSEFEVELMQQLAGQISIALSQGQLMEYLEDRVKLRTNELTQVNQSLQQEIQERKLVGAALRQSEEQLRLITNNLPVLIAYVDTQQCYRFNNQAYAHWLGLAPADIYGQSLAAVMGSARYQTIRPYVETVLSGTQVAYEEELSFQDDQVHSVSVTYVPHIEESEAGPKVKGFFALTTDISDRKAIERMKDEFIAVVSHELRTPLTSIHTSLKLMATGRLGQLDEDGQQMLEVADENTDRLVRLVNNVLDLQRIESGEVTMDVQVWEASDLVEEAAEAMQAIAQQHIIEIHAQSVPLSIWADPDYIMQTLTNLIGNAIKFSTPGSAVHLNVRPYLKPARASGPSGIPRRPHQVPPPTMALFSVQDYGQGIPSDKLTSIFERFQQVDSSDSRKKGGTGLGLAICRKIVEQHGGQIWAESQLGAGSCFCFTVPLSSSR